MPSMSGAVSSAASANEPQAVARIQDMSMHAHARSHGTQARMRAPGDASCASATAPAGEKSGGKKENTDGAYVGAWPILYVYAPHPCVRAHTHTQTRTHAPARAHGHKDINTHTQARARRYTQIL
jgi:hypothetical protein